MRRFWIATMMVLALLVPGVRAVSAGQRGPSPTVAYVVKPGDTLWKIAATTRPDADRRKTIHELMTLNTLRSASLYPGQTIRLPAR